jgi:hypothetical protein
MKRALFIFTIVVLWGCSGLAPEQRAKDSIRMDSESIAQTGLTIHQRAQKITDSLVRAIKKKALFDTVGLYKAPVKILTAKVVKVEYSNTKNVYLAYKNVSGKTIKGVKFRWYGMNAFDEPADLGDYSNEGFGGGFDDDILRPNKTDSGTWNIYSRDAKKIVLAWPYEVSFSDGSKWFIGTK